MGLGSGLGFVGSTGLGFGGLGFVVLGLGLGLGGHLFFSMCTDVRSGPSQVEPLDSVYHSETHWIPPTSIAFK